MMAAAAGLADPILEVQGLRAYYGGTPILHGIDLSVRRGEVVAVIGRNGAGKTTLLKCLLGLVAQGGGRIAYKETDISRLHPQQRARRGIGYIPQGRGLFPRMTVAENLVMGELIGGADGRLRYDLVHEIFPVLQQRSGQQAGTLSGGQQQMLAIGRALVGSPELILLDEPSEGVQPSIVQQISTNLSMIRQRLGTTILLVEQNLQMIRSMAERCYVMEKGRIVDEIAPHSLSDLNMVRRYLAV
jgi:branched-chain amino acid transport system ATP-binding protein